MNWQIDNNNRNEVVKRFYGRGSHDLSAIPYYSLEYSRNFSPVVITNAGSIGGSGVDLANANSVKPVTRAELCELIYENGIGERDLAPSVVVDDVEKWDAS